MKRGILVLTCLFFISIAYAQRIGRGASNCGTTMNPCPTSLCTASSTTNLSITYTVPAGQDFEISFDQAGGCGGSTGYRLDAGERVEVSYNSNTIVAFNGNGSTEATYNNCFSSPSSSSSTSVTVSIIGSDRRDEAVIVSFEAGSALCGAVPVELMHFTGVTENKFNKLTWATATEINNAYFSIEYSRDGQGFKEIGRVDGAVNSIETIEYAFMHEEPNVGGNYYRLLQVDLDGSFEYSNVVVVNRGGDSNISIRPNQVTGTVNVFLNEGYKKDTRGVIYDLLGSEVMNVNISANTTQQSINVNDLPSGHYFFRLEEGRNIEVLRFVKMH